jgi:hypothetical protein
VPKRYLMEGDPYHCQCQKTTRLLKERLGWADDRDRHDLPVRFGPEEWLKPYTVEEVARLAEQGKKKIAVIAPAFSADCIETLEEINEEIRESFEEAGGEEFTYIPCLNDDDAHIGAGSTEPKTGRTKKGGGEPHRLFFFVGLVPYDAAIATAAAARTSRIRTTPADEDAVVSSTVSTVTTGSITGGVYEPAATLVAAKARAAARASFFISSSDNSPRQTRRKGYRLYLVTRVYTGAFGDCKP